MSSSYRDLLAPVRVAACLVGAGVAGATGVSTAYAADTHVQPQIEARVESNTNRNLADEEVDESDATGYIADLAALATITTPRHETVVRPRIRLQEYDNTPQLENIEGFLDLRSEYRLERSLLAITGNYAHEDLYNAELANARFNDVTPEDPTAPESGNLEAGQTRDWLRISPSYNFEFSDRSGIGASVLYDTATYDGGTNDVTDYNYGEAEIYYSWKYSQSLELSIGPYGSRYEARDDSSNYDAYGVTARLVKVWSKALTAELELGYEENDIQYAEPTVPDETVSGATAMLTLKHEGEVSQVRFVGGRMLTPSSDGRKTESDEARLQYTRDFSDRLGLRAAVRYVSDNALGDSLETNNDREFVRAELGVRYRFTEEWYVLGGYRYMWQERASDDNGADNHSFVLGVGYRGLNREGESQ